MREIRIALLKQHGHDPEASLEARDCAAGDTVPGSSSSNIDEVQVPHSLIQRVEQDTKKLDYASEVTSGVAGAADGVGAFNTAGNAVTLTQDFIRKCQFVSNQLDFIVGAVDKIAEVRSFQSIVFRFCLRRRPFPRFIHTPSWHGVSYP